MTNTLFDAAQGVIDRFSGAYRFLSNFWLVTVILDGVTYKSVEHAYQAAKTLDPEVREWIRAADTPSEAKRRGNDRERVRLRHDWDVVKFDVMLDLLRQKFARQPLRGMLLATGDATLIEGNTWGDRTWGVCGGTGENHLGRLLMQVRAEYRDLTEQAGL